MRDANVAASGPSFKADLKDHPSPHVGRRSEGSTVSLFGMSKGTFTAKAGHGPGSLPSEFDKGRYSEKYVMFSIVPSNEYHYHTVALIKFSDKQAGTACFLINGPVNQTANTVTAMFSFLGGTGDGAKLRMSGKATADVVSSPVSLTAHATVTFGKPRPLPAKCRHT